MKAQSHVLPAKEEDEYQESGNIRPMTPMEKAARKIRTDSMRSNRQMIEKEGRELLADTIWSEDGTAIGRSTAYGLSMKVQRLVETAKLPTRNYEGDAGYDIFVSESVTVEPGAVVDVPTGIAVELPHGYWARIVGRSSTIRRRGLLVIEGIIDNGYRGHLFFAVHNMTDEPVQIEAGDRLSQLILHRLYAPHVVEVDLLNESDRAHRGFGSTGH